MAYLLTTLLYLNYLWILIANIVTQFKNQSTMRQILRGSLSSLSPLTPFPIPPYPSPAHCELPFLLRYMYYCSISYANKTINKYIILFSPLSSQMLVYSRTVLLFLFFNSTIYPGDLSCQYIEKDLVLPTAALYSTVQMHLIAKVS